MRENGVSGLKSNSPECVSCATRSRVSARRRVNPNRVRSSALSVNTWAGVGGAYRFASSAVFKRWHRR